MDAAAVIDSLLEAENRITDLEITVSVLFEENQRLELALAKALAECSRKKRRNMWDEPLEVKRRVRRPMTSVDAEESIDEPIERVNG